MDIPQPQMSPEKFVWEKYAGRNGYTYLDIFETGLTTCKIRKDVELIGFCPANRLRVRQRSDGWAVMVKIPETGEEIWTHYF